MIGNVRDKIQIVLNNREYFFKTDRTQLLSHAWKN